MGKKILIVLVVCSGWAAAAWRYDVHSTLLGSMGRIEVEHREQGGRHGSDVTLSTRGLAAFLSAHDRERFHSQGRILKGRYLSEGFLSHSESRKKEVITRYRFDYGHKQIVKQEEKWEKKKNRRSRKSKTLKFFATDDPATLYLNALARLQGKKPGRYRFVSVGASKKDGVVWIEIPTPAEAARERHRLKVGPDLKIYRLKTLRPILHSTKWTLVFAVDSEGITRKAQLRGVPYIGTVTATLRR